MEKKLTRKESRFVEEYILCWNAARAAVKALYSEKNAASIGYQLLQKPHIQAAIEAHLAVIAADNSALISRTLMEYQRIAFFNAQRLFNDDGTPKPIEQLDPEDAAVIAGIEFEDVFEGRGEAREYVGKVRKYKLVDKKGALDSISRYLGMFNDNLKLITPPGQAPIASSGVNIDPSKLSTEHLKVLMEALRVGTA